MTLTLARRPWLAAGTAAVLLLVTAPTPARAADPKPAATALSEVPADAEFYSSSLRLGETIEIIGRSRAWKQIWNEPFVQAMVAQAREKYAEDGEWAALRKFFADPANAELPALAADALANELFVYAGAGTGDLIGLVQELAGGARYGPQFEKLLGGDPGDVAKARTRIALRTLAEKPERLRSPELVIGFKVSDPAKVAAQLKRVDPVLANALKGTQLAGRSGRVTIDKDEFLTFTVDGSLLPWDEIDLAQYEEKEGEFAPLVKALKAKKLTVAAGVRRGYLLIAVGESSDHLAGFGGVGPKLADRPEFKPLAKHAGKPLTAIGYVSQKLRQAVATTPEDVTGFADFAKAWLGQQGELAEADRKAIEKDIDALAQSIIRGLVKPGAMTTFAFRTPRGWETFAHDYTAAGPDDARPLTLLNHVGGDPLLAAVWRSGTTVEDYRALVKWVGVFYGHAEKLAVAKNPDAEGLLKIFRDQFVPLLKELSDVTEKQWLPALEDGQQGVVLDAKWTSKQWHRAAPTDKALPLPEFGVVLGVSDAAKFAQALGGYREVVNKLVVKVSELPATNIPPVQIPKPTVERKGDRSFAFYPIPAEWGTDPQFQPTGGLSPKVAALSLSRGHTERLLTETPFKSGLAPHADLKRPLQSAFYFNWAGLVDTAGPWVDVLTRQGPLAENGEQARQTAKKVTGLLKVFRAYGSATYREGGATVTHGEAVFGDIEREAE